MLDWSCISSDVTRKDIFGMPHYQHPTAARKALLYSKPVTEDVYQRLFTQTLARVQAHHPLVVDATLGQPDHRALFAQALARMQVPFYFLELQLADELIKERLGRIDKIRQVVSDARLEDFDVLRPQYQEPQEGSTPHLLKINAAPGPEVIISGLFKRLARTRAGQSR